jgi:hypothetical protein
MGEGRLTTACDAIDSNRVASCGRVINLQFARPDSLGEVEVLVDLLSGLQRAVSVNVLLESLRTEMLAINHVKGVLAGVRRRGTSWLGGRGTTGPRGRRRRTTLDRRGCRGTDLLHRRRLGQVDSALLFNVNNTANVTSSRGKDENLLFRR